MVKEQMREECSTLLSEVRHVAASPPMVVHSCFEMFSGSLGSGTFICPSDEACGMYSQDMVAHVDLEREEGKCYLLPTKEDHFFVCSSF